MSFDVIVIILFVSILVIIIYINITTQRDQPKCRIIVDMFDSLNKNQNQTNQTQTNQSQPNQQNQPNQQTQQNQPNQNRSDYTTKPLRCDNRSLNDQHESGKKQMMPNRTFMHRMEYASNDFNGQKLEVHDPSAYYRNMYSRNSVKIGDEKYAGYNNDKMPNNISAIGNIPLKKTNEYPIGMYE